MDERNLQCTKVAVHLKALFLIMASAIYSRFFPCSLFLRFVLFRFAFALFLFVLSSSCSCPASLPCLCFAFACLLPLSIINSALYHNHFATQGTRTLLEHASQTNKRTPNGPRTDPVRPSNRSRTDPEQTPCGPRTNPERIPNGPAGGSGS